MMKKHAFLLLLFAVACSKSESKAKPKGSPDWGDDPRPLGSCVGTPKPGTPLPAGSPSSVCLENQTSDECTKPSENFDYVYAEHTTCASRGYGKTCDGAGYPASARFQACPTVAESPNLEPAKKIVAIFQAATRAAEDAKGDCAALGKALAPLRDQLWELTQKHPSALKSLTDRELKAINAADSFTAISDKLPACKDDVHAKEFAYAMGKAL
jgi:hypothetical protein